MENRGIERELEGEGRKERVARLLMMVGPSREGEHKFTALHTAHSTLQCINAHCTLHTVHSLHCISAHFTLYNLRCTLHNPHCTLN